MAWVVVGVVLLALAALLGWGSTRLARQARRIEEVPLYDCAQLPRIGADAPGMRVEVTGLTAPGPDGRLTGPFSGAPCVWYRAVVYERTASEERGPNGTIRRVERLQQMSEEVSTAPFAVVDATGSIEVDPAGAEVDDPVASHDRFEPAPPGGALLGVLRREWLVPPDRQVYVLGGVRAEGAAARLGAARDGDLLLSLRAERELVSRTRLGGRVLAGGAIALAVAGIALVVVGAT
ncbi:MAG: GIDE domain-containing protein [Thermoleophilia bacterium]